MDCYEYKFSPYTLIVVEDHFQCNSRLRSSPPRSISRKGVKTCLMGTEHQISPGNGYPQHPISSSVSYRPVQSEHVSLG